MSAQYTGRHIYLLYIPTIITILFLKGVLNRVGDAEQLRTVRKAIETKFPIPKISSPGPKLDRKQGLFWDTRIHQVQTV